MAGMARWGSAVGLAMIVLGCGGSPSSGASSPGAAAPSSGVVSAADAGGSTPATSPASSPSAAAAGVDPGLVPAAPGPAASAPPPAHPFATTADQATSLIDDAITSRSNELAECVESARTRRKSPHAKLVIEVGMDEEGHLLGVKLPKGEKHDQPFVDCVLAALHGAPFPKSHAGVITVRKTFEDKAVYR